ncbi:MAG: hemolysin family protein [Fimbriimonadales bacterium]|nr:hemolysin family protein [Fimbriimonadales bacterium]
MWTPTSTAGARWCWAAYSASGWARSSSGSRPDEEDTRTMTENPNSRRTKPRLRFWIVLLIAILSATWGLYGQSEPAASAAQSGGLTPTTSLLVILVLLLLSAFFSMAESALTSIRHSWVRMLTEQKHRLAPYLAAFKSEPSRFLSTVQVGLNIVAFLASAVAATNLAEPLHSTLRPIESATGIDLYGFSVALVAIITAFANVIIGETVPRSIAITHAERVALLVIVPMTVFDRLFALPILLVNGMTRAVLRLFGIQMMRLAPVVSEEELRVLVEAGEEQGVIEEQEKEMIQSIFEFTDTIAREVMTPRVDIKAAPTTATAQEIIKLIRESGHTRIPIYEGSLDNIVGIVHAKDLLRYCDSTAKFSLHEVMRPAFFVPESKRVVDLLQEMRRQRTHMAILQDEYGGTSGLVTLEDLVEEIVGEIQDEYDVEPEPQVEQLPDGSLLIDARLHLDDASELLGIALQSDEFDTLGGYVFGQLGHPPTEGETVRVDGWELRVHAIEGHRIRVVQALRIEEEAADSDSAVEGVMQ